MGAKNEWRRSTSGADWTDILMMAKAMESLHECRVGLTAIPASAGHNGSAELSATAVFDRLPASDEPRTVSKKMMWPNAKNLTVDGCFYKLLWELDFAIGESYEQTRLKLWGVPPPA